MKRAAAKPAHTPGPWRATEKTVTAAETEDRLGMECRLYGGSGRDNRANARLIAEAPSLLDALIYLRDCAESGEHQTSERWAQVQAVIKKLTGE